MSNDKIDTETLSLTFQRTLRATREQAFDAWTRPELIAQWWDPTGTPLSRCEIELRVGGGFVFENAGHSPPFVGTYQSVERPSKLAFQAMGAEGTVLFHEQGEHTRMHVTIRSPSREHFERFLKFGVQENTVKTFDNLMRYLERQ